MLEKTAQDNRTLIGFWDRTFAAQEKALAEEGERDQEGWKDLAPSEKLYRAACQLGKSKKVLDYGCGDAWAGIIAAISGCEDVDAVDAAPGAVRAAVRNAGLYGVKDRVHAACVGPDWLDSVPAETYDGIMISNVLDVVPPETAEAILRASAKAAAPDAVVMIGLNYYLSPDAAAARSIELAGGSKLYMDGVLRLVSRTDEEWEKIFSPWYSVVKLEHFAWPGEASETRRLFHLKKNRKAAETQRLIIDQIRAEDKEDYFSCISHDRKVLETFICRYAKTPQELDISPYTANDNMFAIRLKDSGKLIGIILYFDADEAEGSCEIGYGIGSDFWGRGLATEAVAAFLDYLFKKKGFRKVYASFFTGNEASRRVMEKCGMQFDRFSEKELTYLGVQRDLIYYVIRREDQNDEDTCA